MVHSIVIPFRDRHWHLSKLLPRIKELFINKDYEIIIAEQHDENKFRKSSLLDIATRYAKGDRFIFHDVDYYPENVDYFKYDEEPDIVYLPVKTVEFLDNNSDIKHLKDVPSGYRHFKDGVDDDFFGGVVILNRDTFDRINGFNPCYVGWGCEDADIRLRLLRNHIDYVRGNGKFLALDHKDSNPGDNDPDFRQNSMLLYNEKYAKYGIENLSATIVSHSRLETGNILWLDINDFKVDFTEQ